jgi:hypothetical protein
MQSDSFQYDFSIWKQLLEAPNVDAVKPNNTITPIHFNTLICIWYWWYNSDMLEEILPILNWLGWSSREFKLWSDMTNWASYLQMITSPLHTDLYWKIFLHRASVWSPASNKHPPYICSPNHLVLTLHLKNTCFWPVIFIHRTSIWSPASNKHLPM